MPIRTSSLNFSLMIDRREGEGRFSTEHGDDGLKNKFIIEFYAFKFVEILSKSMGYIYAVLIFSSLFSFFVVGSEGNFEDHIEKISRYSNLATSN